MEIGGLALGYAEFKAPKGLIKVEVELAGDKIFRISISGDFFMYPEEALERFERALIGSKVYRENLLKIVEDFFESTGARTPMVEPEHWAEAILRAAGG
jgi:lipoate-protein ligase A